MVSQEGKCGVSHIEGGPLISIFIYLLKAKNKNIKLLVEVPRKIPKESVDILRFNIYQEASLIIYNN